ncbi:hypothetical protein [Pseudomonas sp. PS02290]|uniref:hypothetical protein n=1 Tax=Pseudomonas sp. PS02290 TaxID=2991430 RepID=UPI002499FD6B|nr:hypothetical protein [Pseudomonas sp. PS02290]
MLPSTRLTGMQAKKGRSQAQTAKIKVMKDWHLNMAAELEIVFGAGAARGIGVAVAQRFAK